MPWTEHLDHRQAFRGDPELLDGHSRVHEAMGGLADDDYGAPSPAEIWAFAVHLDDHDRVHEAMSGIVRADDL